MNTTLKSLRRSSMILAVCVALSLLPGCSNWVDSSINTDPNNPQDVPLGLILSGAQGSLAFTYGSDLCRFSSLYTQHHSGVTGQHKSYYENYLLESNEVDNLWQNLYGNVMINLEKIRQKSAGGKSPHYHGVGNVLMAMTLGMVTDSWGDVPFSQALKGDGNLRPVFDSQAVVYDSIRTMLDQALVDLASADENVTPSSDDLMYGGDMSKWIKLAHVLRARYANHAVGKNSSSTNAAILADLAQGFASNDDDLKFSFMDSPSNANPLFSFIQDRDEIRIAPNFAGILNKLQDPRRSIIGAKLKSSKDSILNDNEIGAFYASATSPVVFCSFAEQNFIKAEALLRSGDASGAKAAYAAAVAASLTWFGVASADSTTYMANTMVMPSGDITLEHIITQKYIALYTQMETWTDWRRTKFPSLTPMTGPSVPHRYPVAQAEQLYNTANCPAGSLSDPNSWKIKPMWWE